VYNEKLLVDKSLPNSLIMHCSIWPSVVPLSARTRTLPVCSTQGLDLSEKKWPFSLASCSRTTGRKAPPIISTRAHLDLTKERTNSDHRKYFGCNGISIPAIQLSCSRRTSVFALVAHCWLGRGSFVVLVLIGIGHIGLCSRHQAEIEDDIVGCARAVVIREWILVSKCEAELGKFRLVW
jgi:hypothetical protein